MLLDFFSNRIIKSIPYERDFDIIKDRLSESDIQEMKTEINRRIDNSNESTKDRLIFTAGWTGSDDWVDTSLMKLYKACGNNIELSGKMYGILCWIIVQERPENWTSGRFENKGVDIKSRTYFTI